MKKSSHIFTLFAIVGLIVAAMAGVYLYNHNAGNAPTGQSEVNEPLEPQTGESTGAKPGDDAQPSQGDQSSRNGSTGAGANAQASSKAPSQSPAELFCGRDFSDVSSRTSDAVTLAQAGGVVQIFQHEAALKSPYDCASFYLKHGLSIDAADPRPDSQHLTPLLFSIKRNDPKMVKFVLDHGANLQQRGGPNDTRPYGYAVFMALQNQSTNYNQVIGMLDTAMQDQNAKTASAKTTAKDNRADGKPQGRSGAM